MKIHRFERFSSTHARCGITYSTVCDRGDAYVLSDADESRFPVTCEACILAKSSRAPQLADKRAAPMGVGCQGTPAFGAAAVEAKAAAASDCNGERSAA